jgi:hypothetical protein
VIGLHVYDIAAWITTDTGTDSFIKNNKLYIGRAEEYASVE